jgi:hypothetical protein
VINTVLHNTPAGYVAVSGERPTHDIAELQPSMTIKRVHRTVVLGGIILFIAVLVAATTSGHGYYFFPVAGIMFALALIAYRALDAWGNRAYRRQLHAEQEAGRLVIVPDGLIIQAGATCRELDLKMSNSLFDYDIPRARLLAAAYRQDHRSPDVQKQLSTLIHRCAVKAAGALHQPAAPDEDSSAVS